MSCCIPTTRRRIKSICKRFNRLGVIGIVIDKLSQTAARVNQILSEHADLIIGRMGLPRPDRDLAIISLIIDGSTDEVGSLTSSHLMTDHITGDLYYR
jgi:hypothetical protein